MARETPILYISEVIFKIRFIWEEKIKLKVNANQQKSVSRIQAPSYQ